MTNLRSSFLFLFCVGSALGISLAHGQTQAHFPKIIDESALKETEDPCHDFYQFACGTWLEQTVIPSDKHSVSRQATPMSDAVDKTLNGILEAYARGDFSIPSTYATKLADYYTSCMNAQENAGPSLQLVKEQIKRIEETGDGVARAQLLASLHQSGSNILFRFNSMQDFNDSTQVIGEAGQGGLGLDEKDYYLETDEKSVEIRQKYLEYIAKIFSLLGSDFDAAKLKAKTVMDIETLLATHSYSIADQSDPSKTNHVIGLAGLQKLTPSFDWETYFQSMGVTSSIMNVDEPEFFSHLNQLLTETKKEDLDLYLIFSWVNRAASEMGGEFEEAHFAFWDNYMNGAKAKKPRWQLCTQSVENSLGYALAEAYIKLFDGSAIRQKTESMIGQVREAFSMDLTALNSGKDAWIDDQTMKGALDKISLMGQKVGAPDKFRAYDSLETGPASYLANSLNIAHFETNRDLNKIGKPVDKSEWGMMPWEVNAYYDRSNNEFVFPFGILLPPSLDLEASDGANFGSFGGGTIGHELTHGFDNNGSKYDGNGNLINWWTEQTEEQFKQKAQCYIDQANHYTIASVGLNVDGTQTLEENLADQGGVKLGLMALERILSTRPEGTPWLNKYNERQQYWIAYAQSWCTKSTVENLRARMTTDEHPPAEFRVNGIMMNRPEFARDFNCKIGSRMAPVNRCSLW